MDLDNFTLWMIFNNSLRNLHIMKKITLVTFGLIALSAISGYANNSLKLSPTLISNRQEIRPGAHEVIALQSSHLPKNTKWDIRCHVHTSVTGGVYFGYLSHNLGADAKAEYQQAGLPTVDLSDNQTIVVKNGELLIKDVLIAAGGTNNDIYLENRDGVDVVTVEACNAYPHYM